MNSALKLLDFENPVFRGYLTHAAILVLKMMVMSLLTGKQRFKYRVFPTPEDLKFLRGKTVNKHEEVERVRRAHRNDMENIPIFFIAALAYMLTDPNPAFALNLFRIFTVCRFAHTYVYAIHVIPQPARGIVWWGAYIVTGYMAIKVPISQEDSVFSKGKDTIVQHDKVDRVCSAHRNDLENIPIFLIAGLAYVLTDPNLDVAINLFRAYTICRCVHTFVYAIVIIPQPARALAWVGGYVITGYIAMAVVIYFCKF